MLAAAPLPLSRETHCLFQRLHFCNRIFCFRSGQDKQILLFNGAVLLTLLIPVHITSTCEQILQVTPELVRTRRPSHLSAPSRTSISAPNNVGFHVCMYLYFCAFISELDHKKYLEKCVFQGPSCLLKDQRSNFSTSPLSVDLGC